MKKIFDSPKSEPIKCNVSQALFSHVLINAFLLVNNGLVGVETNLFKRLRV